MLSYHGLPHDQPPREHLLLLVHKKGRRGVDNFDELLGFVRGGCDGQCREVGPPSSHVSVAGCPTPKPKPKPKPTMSYSEMLSAAPRMAIGGHVAEKSDEI